ncbi:pilus assembly protein PilO [Neobacillus sp. OS1-2]|uniref:pilus assembly protein PilO n=1 Tax=Neobacillus sp. OS1-2 TaxID=3070680 RepID=UPI0027E06299|nr:pilus assembly protein PilO [Neobacillus sp. OS1-2]WML40715.1 pilus assembly protein PilO [Neobacillus sp. OS1-2]
MNLELSKKHSVIIILSVLLIIIVTVGAYFLYIVPANNSLAQKKSALKMSNQELSIIQRKLKQTSSQTIQSSMELQKQIPVKRLLDQLLLNIEKAEIISDTNIIELKLNGTESEEDVDLSSTIPKINTQSSTKTNENSTSNQEQSPAQKDVTLPNGIKKTSIILSGEAKTYYELEKFLTELQSLQRIIKIDQFKFTGRDEIYSVLQSMDPLKFEATISAYYFPTLVDLQKEIPPLDTPAVSNKKNPISEFSDTEENGDDDENKNP